MSPHGGSSRAHHVSHQIIHDIHFLSPGNALLATSKAMFSFFTPDALPTSRTAQWVSSVWNNRVEQGTKSNRSAFILKRRYMHSVRMLRRVLRELDMPPGYRVVYYPPLDPSDYIISGGWLPVELLHHIYHTYPTDPLAFSQAVRHLLLRRRYAEADILLGLGADPRSSNTDILQPSEVFFLPEHAVAHLTKVGWSPKWLRRRSCECGWHGVPAVPTPSQRVLLRITAQALQYVGSPEAVSRSIYRYIGAAQFPECDDIKARAGDEGVDEDASIRYPANTYSPWIQNFMLPSSGTIAKFPVQLQDKYADVGAIVKLPHAPEHGRLAHPIRAAYERFLQDLVTAVCKDYWRAYRAVLAGEVNDQA